MKREVRNSVMIPGLLTPAVEERQREFDLLEMEGCGTVYQDPVTASTTGEGINRQSGGYFAEFDAFCHCYPRREEYISEALIHAAFAQWHPRNRSLRILDIGSADGRLLRTLLERLPATPQSIVCLEPCPEGFRQLTELMQGVTAAPADLHQQTLEAWLSVPSTEYHRFDLIICSHVYYHFTDPALITSRLTQLLSPSGTLVAIVDSHDSPLYRWLDTELARSTSSPVSQYGDYFGFEHLRAALNDHQVRYTDGVIESKLVFRTAIELEHAAAFLSRRKAVDDGSRRDDPGWARTFPCETSWREGFVVVREGED